MSVRAGAATRWAIAVGVTVATVTAGMPPAGASASSPPPDGAAADRPAAGRTLVDQDDFTGSVLDSGKWVPYDETSSNGISHWTPKEITVGDGELRINSQGKDPSGANNYSGALTWSRGKGNQTYGVWMVRARFDAGAGYGPAILLWPQSDDWPRDGEIDLVESVQPSRDTALASLHWGDTPPGHRESGTLHGDYTRWHVYAVDWQPTYVKISVDGQTAYDSRFSTLDPAIPSTPMHLVIQQEPGPFGGANWIVPPGPSTPDDVVTHVDWVRMYR